MITGCEPVTIDFTNTSRDLEDALEMGMDWSLREGMYTFADLITVT